MFSLIKPKLEARRHRRKLRDVPRHLPPHLMRDIGLAPWPEEHPEEPSLRRHLW